MKMDETRSKGVEDLSHSREDTRHPFDSTVVRNDRSPRVDLLHPHRLDRFDDDSAVHVRSWSIRDRGAGQDSRGQAEPVFESRAQILDQYFDSTSNRKVGGNDMENVDAVSHRVVHFAVEHSVDRAVVIGRNTRLTLGEFG